MNNQIVEWRAPQSRLPAAVTMLPVVAKEAKRRSFWLAAVFATIALLALLIGWDAPKQFTSSTTMLVEEASNIEPLLKGRTAPSNNAANVIDRAGVARQVAFSSRVMEDILKTGGWYQKDMDPVEKLQLIDQITASTEIENPDKNLKLVKISYTDSDPQRAQKITQRFAQLIIEESHRTEERESRAAFTFLDSQVKDYHKRLTDAENKLAAYRKAHPEVMMGDQEDVTRRITTLRTELDRSMMDYADQSSRAGAWQSHLARESRMAVTQARPNALRGQLNTLYAERDKLSGTVTAQHPDMRAINNQIAAAERQLRSGGGPAVGTAASAAMSPEYTGVRTQAAEAAGMRSASASRLSVGQRLIKEELDRLTRVATLGGELANLTRNFELNRTLYQDLAERRENARLAMNLDAQKGGLNFRVQEPANLPVRSEGVSLTHFATGGLALAVAAPLLLLFGWVRFDPRVRTASQIETVSGLPVLGTIPAGPGPRHGGYATAGGSGATAVDRKSRWTVPLLLAVPVAYALAMILR